MGTAEEAAKIDTGRPTAARMYDYYLGGSTNFPADRAAAEQVIASMPLVPDMARTHRSWLIRAVRYVADQGIRQFLDIGSGVPTMGNVHEIAQQVAPEARTLYVDLDPVAVLHAQQLLEGNDLADAIPGDLGRPAELLHQIETEPHLSAIIDLKEPVGLILACVLHFIKDDEEAYSVMDALRESLAPGSWIVLSHSSRESYERDQMNVAEKVYARTPTPGVFRSREQVLRFFRGTELVEPGLVWTPQWRPSLDDPQLFTEHPHRAGLFCGVSRIAAPC